MVDTQSNTSDLKKSSQPQSQITNNNYHFVEHHFPKRPTLDLSFSNITYTSRSWSTIMPVKKTILHGVSGEFRSGELTAIMGPSGAGKSTLLNILAGFSVDGGGGSVMVNGQDRNDANLKHFLRVSCYIQQNDELRPLLTVEEAMMMASYLKLGSTVSRKNRRQQIIDLLTMLGLSNQKKTMTGRLSGGQKRRLSIALELITNPPLIFLDEPTSGLDSSSTSSCVSLLRDLAREGRTVVCTIHQPSALVFEQFDHLYAVASGRCIYEGSIPQLVPHMADIGLICPRSHNPADFLIEVATGDFGLDIKALEDAAAHNRRASLQHVDEITANQNGLPLKMMRASKRTAAEMIEFSSCQPDPPPLWAQCYQLYMRNLTIVKRSWNAFALRLVVHIVIGLVFGYIYHGVGARANAVLANLVFIYGSNLFIHYTGQMAVTLAFPLEFKVLMREHFNRWYSLAPYCLSVVLIEIPFQLLCTISYVVPAYYMTGQPLEWFRFTYFTLITMVISLTSQGYGFMVGASLPVGIGVFIGPITTVFLSVFGFSTHLKDLPITFRFFYHLSYLRACYCGSVYTLYGMNRTVLDCPDLYCHYRSPSKFLKDLDIYDVNLTFDINYTLLCGAVFYFLTVCAMWLRLNKR